MTTAEPASAENLGRYAQAAEIDSAELRGVMLEAGEQAVRMREEEGKRLEADLRQRVAAMEQALRRRYTRLKKGEARMPDLLAFSQLQKFCAFIISISSASKRAVATLRSASPNSAGRRY